MHGLYIRPIDQAVQPVTPIMFIKPFILAITLLLGFGLLFSYNKRLIFSGVGFTFFIFAYSLQLYPLVNGFWSKVGVFDEFASDSAEQHPFYLSRFSSSPVQNNI